jgi:hypothetical protein
VSSRTRTRRPQRRQPARKPAATQPPLRLVDLSKPRTYISLVKPLPEPAPVLEDPAYFDLRANAASAAIYTGTLNIHAPYNTWTGMSTGQATALLPTGARLVYSRNPGRLTAHQLCPHGAWHHPSITGPADLDRLAAEVADCTRHNPRAQAAARLGNSIHRAHAAAADTAQTDVTHLRATHNQPKEHPQT